MVKLGKSNTRTRTKKGTRNKQTANKQTTKKRTASKQPTKKQTTNKQTEKKQARSILRIIQIKRKKLLDQKESCFGKLLSC